MAAVRPEALAAAVPVLAAWFVSPVVAFWVSRPRPVVDAPLTDEERDALRQVARKTWGFFETFVGDEDHWLPPDNYQEDPDGRSPTAPRRPTWACSCSRPWRPTTSATSASARLVERLEKTFDTLDRLETHRGHFFNWYDTRTLQPLPPAYVSTVDSGNLLGCLLALEQGLQEKAEEPLLGPEVRRAGLADTLGLVAERRPREPAGPMRRSCWREEPDDLLAWDDWLRRMDWAVIELIGRIRSRRRPPPSRSGRGERPGRDASPRRSASAGPSWPRSPPGWPALRDWEAGGGGRWTSEDAARTLGGDPPGTWRAPAASPPSPTGSAPSSTSWPRSRRRRRPSTGSGRSRRTVRGSAAADWLGRLGAWTGGPRRWRPRWTSASSTSRTGTCSPSASTCRGPPRRRHYDLLASEACLTSFLAVARGEAPGAHWFQLGRPLHPRRRAARPGLLGRHDVRVPDAAAAAAGAARARSGREPAARPSPGRSSTAGRRGVPWGISESAFNAQYADGDYQYQAFGVPGLGLKRGLDRDLVVAPYADGAGRR